MMHRQNEEKVLSFKKIFVHYRPNQAIQNSDLRHVRAPGLLVKDNRDRRMTQLTFAFLEDHLLLRFHLFGEKFFYPCLFVIFV